MKEFLCKWQNEHRWQGWIVAGHEDTVMCQGTERVKWSAPHHACFCNSMLLKSSSTKTSDIFIGLSDLRCSRFSGARKNGEKIQKLVWSAVHLQEVTASYATGAMWPFDNFLRFSSFPYPRRKNRNGIYWGILFSDVSNLTHLCYL